MESKEHTLTLLKMIVPEEIELSFELQDVKEWTDRWELSMVEKPEHIPTALQNKVTVLDGFCNAIELESFPIKGKSCYIKLLRRRWKEAGTKKSYWNEYNFHCKGSKATKEFGAFLKEAIGYTTFKF